MADESLSLTHRVATGLVRWRWMLLAVSLVLTVAGLWPASQLRFDVSIANLFPPDDPVLRAYQDSLRVFGSDELIVVAYTDPQLLTADGLLHLHQLSETFRALQPLGLERVASLADERRPRTPLDPTPLFEQIGKQGCSAEELKAELLKSELYRNVFLAADGQTTAITLTLRPEHTDVERRRLMAGIRERAGENRFQTVVAGGPVLTHDAVVFVDQDGRTLGWVSTLALVVVIGILFRRVRWVVLPLAVVHVTLVWTKALLWLAEAHLSMVSTTLTALVTVIGVAGVVQVTARYREERERADVTGALLGTMAAAGPAVFWASLTTAAGIGSLLISSIVPVRNFAIMLSLASMLVFLVTAALVPGVVLFGRRPSDPGAAPGERGIERILEATMAWSLARPRQLAVVVLVLLALTIAGIFRIRAETDFTRNFRRSSEVVVAYNFVEERLGGVGTMQLDFSAPDGLTPELADRLRKLEARLRKTPNLTKVLGLVDVVDFFDVGVVGTLSRWMGPQAGLASKLWVLRQQRPDLVPTFWNEKEQRMRVMLRAREQASSDVKQELMAAVADRARSPRPAAGPRRRARDRPVPAAQPPGPRPDVGPVAYAAAGNRRRVFHHVARPPQPATGRRGAGAETGPDPDGPRSDGLAGRTDRHGHADDRLRLGRHFRRLQHPLPVPLPPGASGGGPLRPGAAGHASPRRGRDGLCQPGPGCRLRGARTVELYPDRPLQRPGERGPDRRPGGQSARAAPAAPVDGAVRRPAETSDSAPRRRSRSRLLMCVGPPRRVYRKTSPPVARGIFSFRQGLLSTDA